MKSELFPDFPRPTLEFPNPVSTLWKGILYRDISKSN